MLHVYYGREDINRARFIYENVKAHSIIIVPDQFTVQAERDAFFYMQKKGLMDVEVLSFSRLADRIFSQAGGGRTKMIDRQGRHMLLTKIIRDLKSELKLYRGYSSNTAFIEMTNDFISEIKQRGRTPDDLEKIAGMIPDRKYLVQKLEDIRAIFAEYERHIEGKYIDTEDRAALMTEKIGEADIIRENSFWIYGFDYFAPKNRDAVGEIIKHAPETNVVMTWDDGGRDRALFEMTGKIIDGLLETAAENGIAAVREAVGGEYREVRPGGIQAVEKNIFALPHDVSEDTEGLQVIRAAGYYGEAETAAVEVLRLLREEGMRCRDIAVICNDLEVRGPICKRTFARYGLDLFVDEKKSIMNHPAVNYIIALMDIISGGYRPEDVIRLAKTGLAGLDDGQVEEFEDYVIDYRIRGPLFREELQRGLADIGEDRLKELEGYRSVLIDGTAAFAERFKAEKTAGGKARCLYGYIADDCGLPEKISRYIDEKTAEGKLELAGESAQIWNVTVNIFDQIVEIIGDENISMKDFAAVFRSGLEAVEIGLIPPAADGILMGTMQRTRTGRIRALLVIGANEGVIPAEVSGDGILNEDEKDVLDRLDAESDDMQLCKMDRLRMQEETLAIYRNLSRPAAELWISCSASDENGKAIRPSRVYDDILAICPGVTVKNDIITEDDASGMTSSPEACLEHLTSAIQSGMKDGQLDDWWKECILWFREHEPERIAAVTAGLFFDNSEEDIEKAKADLLFKKGGILSLSPSRLELFGGCPFAHFIRYGLRPEENDSYTVEPRDMGDMYHMCLMKTARQLTADGLDITDPESPWMTVSREECDQMADKMADEEMAGYKGGLFSSSNEEAYRGSRMKELCRDAVWMMVSQARRGSIERMEQEIRFGRNDAIEPIKVDIGGETVYIEGIIDRVDYLPDDNVKVIDYKSGSNKYSEEEARSGWKLQLFAYLRAACGGSRKPAGAFYFHIADPEINAGSIPEEEMKARVGEEIRKAFRMDGVVVDEETVVESIEGSSSDKPHILPSARSSRKRITREELETLMKDVSGRMDDMCREMAGGCIRIRPKRYKDNTACRYCRYRGICKFDTAFDGCSYDFV